MLEHPENAYAPIDLTWPEMSIDVKREHPENALSPIKSTVVPIVTVEMVENDGNVSLNREINSELLTDTETKLIQPEKALLPMETIELGMLMEVRLKQLENAEASMRVTESGMFTEIKLKQLENADAQIVSTRDPRVTV